MKYNEDLGNSYKVNAIKSSKPNSELQRLVARERCLKSNPMKDRLWIKKDKEMKVIFEHEINYYRDRDWIICREEKIKPTLWIINEYRIN